jgi:Cu-processing system ATP-binding protein
MISLSGINKKFGRQQVLNDITLYFREGQSIALIGPNGSGKTTLIKCLLGMVIPDTGTIRLRDADILHDWTCRTDMGYMPQIARYPENMTIAQLFDMMKDIRKDTRSGIDEDLFHAFRLDHMLDKRMRTLSGGTRQKVSASLAFLFNPSVLILDEPTAGLDPVASGILQEKIHAEREKGKLILITSHILSELDGLVSEVVYLHEGKVQFHKSLRQLQKDTGEEKLVRAIAHVMQNIG